MLVMDLDHPREELGDGRYIQLPEVDETDFADAAAKADLIGGFAREIHVDPARIGKLVGVPVYQGTNKPKNAT